MARVFWYEYRDSKKPGQWWIDYNDAEGVRHRQPAHPNKAQAQLILAAKLTEVAKEKLFGIEPSRRITFTTFTQYGSIYLATYAKVNKRSWKMDEQIIHRMSPHIGDKFMHSVTCEDITKALASLKGTLTNSTINRYRTMLHCMWNLAIKAKRAHSNPVSDIQRLPEPKPTPHYCSREQMDSFLQVSPQWFREILLLAVLTGLRAGALLSILITNINLDVGIIYIERDKDGEKFISLSEQGKRLVRHLLEKPRPKNCPYLFFVPKKTRNMEGKFNVVDFSDIGQDSEWSPMDVRSGSGAFRRTWESVRRAAGMPNYKFAWFRQTHASWLAMAGADLRAIQRQLGHSRYDLTEQRYAHLSPAYRNSQIQKIDSTLQIGSHMAAGEPAKIKPINEPVEIAPKYRLNYNSWCGGEVANAAVCKTVIRGFKSHPHLIF